MKISKPLIIKLLIFLLTLSVCATIVTLLYSMEPKKEIREKVEEKLKPVTVIKALPDEYRSIIKVFGEAYPKWSTTIRSQASGQVITLSDNLETGKRLKINETIIQIDKSNYIAGVAEAKLRLENAKVQYLQEKQKSESAREDWVRSGIKGEPDSPLVFYEPQMKAAKAEIEAAERGYEKAVTELKYTSIKAPYDGLVVERLVNKGDTVFAGDKVAKIISDKDIEIKVSLDNWQASILNDPKKNNLKITDTVSGTVWNGRVIRESGHIDNTNRMRGLFIKADDSKKRLLSGTFVSVSIEGKAEDNLFAVPESALTSDGFVWHVDSQHTLRSIKADIAFYKEGNVYIRNINDFAELNVVVNPIDSYMSGIKVDPVYNMENQL